MLINKQFFLYLGLQHNPEVKGIRWENEFYELYSKQMM